MGYCGTSSRGGSTVSLFPIHGKPASHAPGNCILNFLSTETASRPKIKYHYVQFFVPAAYARQQYEQQHRNPVVPEDKGLLRNACRRVIRTRGFSSFSLLKAFQQHVVAAHAQSTATRLPPGQVIETHWPSPLNRAYFLDPEDGLFRNVRTHLYETCIRPFFII